MVLDLAGLAVGSFVLALSGALVPGPMLSATVAGSHRRGFWFGPGVIRKRIPLDEIADVEATRTTFWQGWGIHWTTRGWLYNISGFDAVLVRLRTGKSLLVGTDEPEALANAIREGVSPPRHL